MRLSFSELAEAVGGTLKHADPNGVISCVSTDSRKEIPGGLFIAIPGERFDGHDFLDAALKDLSNCNTAMSMLVIGTILADVKPKEMLDKSVFLFSGLRLILIPLLTYIGCLLCHVEGLATGVSVLLAAMPAASTTAILAAKYDGDAVYASKCVVTTTVLSLLTTPIWSMILLKQI